MFPIFKTSGNALFGIPIYAQQFVTVIALFITLLAIVYTRIIFLKTKGPSENIKQIRMEPLKFDLSKNMKHIISRSERKQGAKKDDD